MKSPKFNAPLHVVRAEASANGNDTTFDNRGVLTVHEKTKDTKLQFDLNHGTWFFKCMILTK